MSAALGIRWTVGDVSPNGFEALRLSVWGARRAFGSAARLVVYVNRLPIAEAVARTGPLPDGTEWRAAEGLPDFLRHRLGPAMAEGVAWKFAPIRAFPGLFELALDNDCILWSVPPTIARWLAEPDPRCLIAGDDEIALGAFTPFTRPEPRNSGIRGLPPHYDYGDALEQVLARHGLPLRTELDEQGLQALAVDLGRRAHVVPTSEVALCSPIWPHRPRLGENGGHFIGLNARELPFRYYGRPASEWLAENWARHRPTLYDRVGLGAPR